MRIWKYRTKEPTIHSDFERGTVQADTFDKALKKVRAHYKEAYGGIKVEVVEISLETEVSIE